MPAYQVTEEHFHTIAATFVRAFPESILVRDAANADSPILGLIGLKDSGLNWSTVKDKIPSIVNEHGLTDPALQSESFPNDLLLAIISNDQYANHRINTLENAILEIVAGKHRATYERRPSKTGTDEPYLRGERWDAFVQKTRR